YMDGWWTSDALDETMCRLVDNRDAIQGKFKFDFSLISLVVSAKFRNRQSKRRAIKVAEKHYDIGNDLYEAMLDSNMQYSCGYWHRGAKDLEQAQLHKLELIAEKLKLAPGMTVLDIGCGWGGLAAHLAKNRGANVVGLTISNEQITFAKERYGKLGIDFVLEDYRTFTGQQFDRIVSVGMLEHVGHKNLRTYMECIYRYLKDDGICLIHSIGDTDSSTVADPWIDKYIFPNGMLPSVRQIGNAIVEPMVLEDWHNFGVSYEKTLLAWHERFVEAWPTLNRAGKYDDRFFKMWEYYLLASAGNFRSRRSAQLWQIVLSKSGVNGGYDAVR
ncbi:MAG: cyclopropane fatty acyl phospholipid synthase, partial [Boseongicola sp.]